MLFQQLVRDEQKRWRRGGLAAREAAHSADDRVFAACGFGRPRASPLCAGGVPLPCAHGEVAREAGVKHGRQSGGERAKCV